MRKIGVLVASYLFLAAGTVQAEDVDVQLVLAVDVSSSVNYTEFGLQMGGYAAAFRSGEVHNAIAAGGFQKIAVAMTQWSGVNEQVLVLDWTVISGAQDAENYARQLENMPRFFPYGGTAIAPALAHAFRQFNKSPHQSLRRVIDLSGDGSVSIGNAPNPVRDAIVRSGTAINALAIMNDDPQLDRYFEQNVIGGAGAFVEISKDYEDFSRAITKKLAREIKGVWVGM